MPSSKLCALGAALTFASATAALAAATQVNIADPNAASRAAHVEPGNRLAVQEVPPTSFFHSTFYNVIAGGCQQITTPPYGKALIVRQVRVNITADPGPNANAYIGLYVNAGCDISGIVGRVTPAGLGLNTITFDPGLVIPAGGVLSAGGGSAINAEVIADGYTVASGVAPAAP